VYVIRLGDVVHVRPSVRQSFRMFRLRNYCMTFDDIWYLRPILKIVG